MTSTMYEDSVLPFHIQFTCPHCSAVRQVPEQYAGQSGFCNTCGGAITIHANTSPPLPRISLDACPREWYRERMNYLDFCRDNYDRARAQFDGHVDEAYWQGRIREAATCRNRAEQVAFWERLVAEGIPWSVAFEYLVQHYAKDHDYERAYYFCSLYFLSDRWKNPQCAGSSYKLLKIMRKLDKKLFGA